jgi:hypothetical protein
MWGRGGGRRDELLLLRARVSAGRHDRMLPVRPFPHPSLPGTSTPPSALPTPLPNCPAPLRPQLLIPPPPSNSLPAATRLKVPGRTAIMCRRRTASMRPTTHRRPPTGRVRLRVRVSFRALRLLAAPPRCPTRARPSRPAPGPSVGRPPSGPPGVRFLTAVLVMFAKNHTRNRKLFVSLHPLAQKLPPATLLPCLPPPPPGGGYRSRFSGLRRSGWTRTAPTAMFRHRAHAPRPRVTSRRTTLRGGRAARRSGAAARSRSRDAW